MLQRVRGALDHRDRVQPLDRLHPNLAKLATQPARERLEGGVDRLVLPGGRVRVLLPVGGHLRRDPIRMGFGPLVARHRVARVRLLDQLDQRIHSAA